MNWGHGIVVAFVLFAILVAGLVTVSMKQDVNLVAADYYNQEIAYEQQIQRIRNFDALAEKPNVKVSQSEILIDFSDVAGTNEGSFLLFRPSSSKQDVLYKIDLDKENQQRIDIRNIERGLWKGKLQWSDGTKEYYHDVIISL